MDVCEYRVSLSVLYVRGCARFVILVIVIIIVYFSGSVNSNTVQSFQAMCVCVRSSVCVRFFQCHTRDPQLATSNAKAQSVQTAATAATA